MDNKLVKDSAIKHLCEEFRKYNHIDPSLYEKFDVKRGLRNQDGTGVMAGLTQICNVHGYIVSDGERQPVPGRLYYRGYDIEDIVKSCQEQQRFGFEETIYLLLFGVLPTQEQLDQFIPVIINFMHLPENFFEDMILKAPSPNIMNKLARAILAMYSYDDTAENTSLESELEKALRITASMSNISVKAYQVRRRYYEDKTMYLHPIKHGLSIAEEFLSLLRIDRSYTKEEALLLDLCLILHAEHGGGNNSTFACRVLSSSGTDAYSAYAGAVGSLKGPKHGGANIKVLEMVNNIKANVADITDRKQVCDYLVKIINKEANDYSGLVYGMGHAVYTISDPRANILKENAIKLAKGTEFENDFTLLEIIEKETPRIFAELKGSTKEICANVDLYSGLVYKMLKIPEELFTPLFATSRMAGWSAHRIEELLTGNRIIRPAYKSVSKPRAYVPINERR
ncbi:citrate synthase [Paludicola sp. MB14-C6]|uniref:citrate synthase n=1 Tax=Paludihabitans sp. MB14-C6 TaxID=3070656 RepID=UPI0027DABB6A|nr:citrate synthase [Paludicola sp. MB14-C6]WMJ22444.1 citrate synthase [Paludicola sp. MB14-C6]